jgi:hypothetical protein
MCASRRASRSLAFERFERRDLPAGTVTLLPNYSAGLLEITGDGGDNAIRLSVAWNGSRSEYRVEPLWKAGATSVRWLNERGQWQSTTRGWAAIPVARLPDLEVRLNNGDDDVTFVGAYVRMLKINTGSGNDSVTIRNTTCTGALTVSTGGVGKRDADTVRLINVDLRSTVRVDSGVGNDFIEIANATCSRPMVVNSGIGLDTVKIRNSMFYTLTVQTEPRRVFGRMNYVEWLFDRA